MQSYILKQQWCLSVWAVPGRFFQSLHVPCGADILYIKTTVVFVCVGSVWKILLVTARSLWCLFVCGDKQGRAGVGQGGAARAAAEGAG